MNDFCAMKGIRREFSVARTPQQNIVAERRNKTLIEAARTMALVVKPHNKTPYELFRGRTPALSFMRPFGCHLTIPNTLDHLGKFDGKADEGYFVGYSMNSKDFRVYNIRTRRVEENLHIEFLENKHIVAGAGPEWLFDIDMLTKSMNYMQVIAGTNSDDFADSSPLFDSSPKLSNDAGLPSFGDDGKKLDRVLDKESGASNELNYAFENLNTKYPNDPKMLGLETIATHDDSEEEGKKAIGTKWVFKNKKYERGIMIKNKARLVAQGHTQEEGIDYDEVFAPIARIKAIRLFLAYASFMGFMRKDRSDLIYQEAKRRYFAYTDMKSASTLVDMEKTLVNDIDGDDVDVHFYRSMIGSLMYLIASRPDIIDYARASLDRKSTTRGCQFLGSILISWQCKKQTVVATQLSASILPFLLICDCDITIPSIDEEIEDDNLHEKLLKVNLLIAKIEALKDNPTPSFEFLTKSSSTSLKSVLEETNTFDDSLPESENF
nr:retrovirus-related Pol polyprotein from transposon TNT 1-94 [Tanacetum cinerariifolium]